jgi:hypothetical protein
MWFLENLFTKPVLEEPTSIEVTLYTTATSKSSTKFKHGFWRWSTKPSIYALQNQLTVLRTTTVKVDISRLKFVHVKGDYYVIVKNKALQRKLLAISKPCRLNKKAS